MHAEALSRGSLHKVKYRLVCLYSCETERVAALNKEDVFELYSFRFLKVKTPQKIKMINLL